MTADCYVHIMYVRNTSRPEDPYHYPRRLDMVDVGVEYNLTAI